MGESMRDKIFLLENHNLIWSKSKVRKFRDAWVEGMLVDEIAEYMESTETEIVLLGIDQFGLEKVKNNLAKNKDEGVKE